MRYIIEKIISGAQTGADIAGLKVAKQLGIPTGGCMPKGFRTLDGDKPEYEKMFNIKEHISANYASRTYDNVKNSDATMRFASNFESSGELCTLKAINQYKKPFFDVHVKNVTDFRAEKKQHPQEAAKWIKENNIKVLNVAGNSNKTAPGIENYVEKYLTALFNELKKIEFCPGCGRWEPGVHGNGDMDANGDEIECGPTVFLTEEEAEKINAPLPYREWLKDAVNNE